MATTKKSTPKRSEAELQRDIYSPLVTKLDDNHELKTNIKLLKSKPNQHAEPDYIMQINGNWTPLEVFSTAINENFREPLERICKYAHNSSFRDQSHADNIELEPIAITPPHGFVLIGDAQTIYLGYASIADIGVNPELEPGSHNHGFVYQNDKPVSWRVSTLSDAVIQDMRDTVQGYIVASQKSKAILPIKDTLPPPTNYTQLRHQLRNTRITSQKSLTEKQLQELLYNPVVKEIDDNHELKTNVELLKSTNAEPDYIMQINGNWTPLEIFATAINENTRVPLERICKYAYNGSFRDESHAGNNETVITPPHGFVLIGDAQTIYLGYASTADIGVNKELEAGTHTHGFVYQNDKPVSWQVSTLSDAMIQDMRNTVQGYIASSQKSKAILIIKNTLPAINYKTALQPLRPYTGGNADLMDTVASLADEIKGLAKTDSPIENLCLCTPVGDNVYFTRIDDVWFPVHINYAGTPTAIDYKKYTYLEEFKAPSAVIPIDQAHGISLVASMQGIDIMYTDENGKTTKSLKKIAINTTSTKARQTILECYSDNE